MKTCHVLFIILFIIPFYTKMNAQDNLYTLSFKANQGHFEDSYCQYYYKLQKDENKYRLFDPKNRDIFQKKYDTIVKNASFIKTVDEDVITIYRSPSLEKIEIPNMKQAYFVSDGLEVLTNLGAQYYDNAISKIYNFPPTEYFKCGTVYSKEYRLEHIQKTNTHNLFLSYGDFGNKNYETTLTISLSEEVDKISFLEDTNYVSKSINNDYNPFPELLIVTKKGKSGIYTYNIEEAIYPTKEKKKVKNNSAYVIDKITGDTISIAKPVVMQIEPISFIKKGTIKIHEVLPVIYDKIERSKTTGLIYLHKDNFIGIYPNHNATTFQAFNEKTKSFYSIEKNNEAGWIDIRTFKEYFFQKKHPELPLKSKFLKNIVPKDWKILSEVKGDLNKDGIEDMAFVIQNTAKENFKASEGTLGRDTLDLNPRILGVYFGDTDGWYEKKLQSDNFILLQDSPTMDEPFDGLAIDENGNLLINFKFWYSAGSWYMSNHQYSFKFQDNEFQLVYYESSDRNRGTGETNDYIIDFLAKTMRVINTTIDENTDDEIPVEEITTFELPELKSIKALQKPFEWEFQNLRL